MDRFFTHVLDIRFDHCLECRSRDHRERDALIVERRPQVVADKDEDPGMCNNRIVWYC